MSDDAVKLDIDDGVATITLSRPEQRNALTHEVASAISETVETVSESDARCLVVTGAGSAFSAGGDIQSMHDRVTGDDMAVHDVIEDIVEVTGAAVADVATCRVPTIAAVDGPAFGAGANLAIACDVVLASSDAQISFGFRQVGLAVDAGTSYLLPRIVGENVAKELIYTGELVDADGAADLGLFNHVYDGEDFDARVDEFVEPIATGPTVALAASKRLVRKGLNGSLETAIENEGDAQAAVLETADHREGVAAFLERRDPTFEGR